MLTIWLLHTRKSKNYDYVGRSCGTLLLTSHYNTHHVVLIAECHNSHKHRVIWLHSCMFLCDESAGRSMSTTSMSYTLPAGSLLYQTQNRMGNSCLINFCKGIEDYKYGIVYNLILAMLQARVIITLCWQLYPNDSICGNVAQYNNDVLGSADVQISLEYSNRVNIMKIARGTILPAIRKRDVIIFANKTSPLLMGVICHFLRHYKQLEDVWRYTVSVIF